MATPVPERAKSAAWRRMALRAEGLRPMQIWAPNTRRPGFAEECRRQVAAVARADQSNGDMLNFLDTALSDLDDGAGGLSAAI